MTESSSADRGYWVSPLEELAQQEDALWDETQGSGAAEFGPAPGGDASTFAGQHGYDGTSAIGTQEYVPEQFAAPLQEAPYNTFQEPYAPAVDTNVPAEETYAPAADPVFGGPAEGMLCSWYGPGFHGSPTASGEPFDPYGFTAAHPYLPFGTQLDVSYGGNSVRVTVNDRGPFTGDRELDLSEGAAQALGLTQAGVDYVGVSYPGADGPSAAPSTPAVDTSYVPPNTYDPNLSINPRDGSFIPEEEFGDPYDDDLDA